MTDQADIKKGLAGVVADYTAIFQGQRRNQLAAVPRLPRAGSRTAP